MKRMISALLCLALMLGFVPFMSAPQSRAAETVPEGYIAISTPEDLFLIRNNMAGNYMLTNDIDLTEALAEGGSLYNKTDGWIALGYNSSSPVQFTGILDGNGYKIYGLQCTGIGAGLIWDNAGTIQNVSIASGSIVTSKAFYVGAICAKNCGVIYNCQNYASISATLTSAVGNLMDLYSGGITGYLYGTGSIALSGNYGIIRANNGISSPNAAAYAGGIFGYGSEDTSISFLWNCGDITCNRGHKYVTPYAGGIAGYYWWPIVNAYNAGSISCPSHAGGIVGRASSSTKMSCCYNIGKISSDIYAGGLSPRFGYADNTCYYINTSTSAIGADGRSQATSLSDSMMQRQASFAGFDFENVWVMGDCTYKYPIFKAAAASSHNLEYTDSNEETCTESGNYEYWHCVNCDAFFADASATQKTSMEELTIPASHKYIPEITAPNCTEQGYTTNICSVCGEVSVDDYVDALGHNWDDGTETLAPTCTENGTKVFTCLACGEIMSEAIKAIGHSYEESVVAPTCTENGYNLYTCSSCGDSYMKNYVDATGHSYTSETTAPNCTEQGCTTYTCTACGDTYADSYVDALGHAWDDGSQILAPTCTEEGKKLYTCLTCGATKEEAIEANGHSYEDTVTAPTCTENGYTTHTCTVCGDDYIDTSVDALGHTWNDGEIVTAATCTANGEMKYTCTACGETKEETILASGHNYVDTITRPTCTETGYTTHTCSGCGDSYKDTYVGATGHAWNDGIEVVKATCTEKGDKVFTCGNCGETRSEDIAPLGHSRCQHKKRTGETRGFLCRIDRRRN